MADDFKDDLITDLKVLSMVPPCGRLNIRNGMLNLEASAFWVPAKRWIMMQNRSQVVQHIRLLFTRIDEVLARGSPDSFFNDQVKEVRETVITGLGNMRATYSSDAQTSAYIELLMERWKHVTGRLKGE
jgi:hypothetical protein